MAFEAEPCAIYAATGELLARGFVREHAGSRLVMAAQAFTGAWLDAGDHAVVEILSTDRGVLSFDVVVESSELGRIVLGSLTLREAVQHRASLRVRTEMVLAIVSLVAGGKEQALEPAWTAHVEDISADGVRFRTSEELEIGHRVGTTVTLGDRRLDLVLEVVRCAEVRGGVAYGCRILGVSERDRDALFRFVLDRQRQSLAQRAELR
jgi:c-di-GMP-binding flagellar brake protein YcgR